MEERRNKFTYDKEYYRGLSRNTVIAGNTARKLNIAEYELYEPETERRNKPVHVRQPKQKIRRVVSINLFHVSVLLLVIGAFVYSSFRYLEVQSDIVQTDKAIAKAQNELKDARAKNEALSEKIVVSFDRDYIYNEAVVRLGMIYPDESQIIYYTTVDEGYVKQYKDIPTNS